MKGIRYVGFLNHRVHVITEHQHPCYEFVYYAEGSGVLQLEGQSHPFKKHDVFVIPPNTNHMENSVEGFKNYHFTFTDIDLEIHGFLHVKDDDDQVILYLVRQMYHEFHLKRTHWERIINDFGSLVKHYLMAFNHDSKPMNADVKKVINQIINHYTDPLFDARRSMADLTYHVDHFRKLFVEATHKTPAQYLQDKRIAHATYLIETMTKESLTLKGIAHASGFLDYYHFSRVFKRHRGISPRAYRDFQDHGIDF